jgi:hypothetical protein
MPARVGIGAVHVTWIGSVIPSLVCDNRQEIDWFERASVTILGELLFGAHDQVRAPGYAFQHKWASTPGDGVEA